MQYCKKFSVSKTGNDEEHNQDAISYNNEHSIFCISDGATESSYSKEWANLIVRHFLETPFDKENRENIDLKSWIGQIQIKWYENIPWDNLAEISENFVEKTQMGAQATFLGFILEKEKNQTKLYAWAIGDSTLFIIKNGEELISFPMTKSDEFDTSPSLLFSMSKKRFTEDNSSEYYVSSKEPLFFQIHNLKKGDVIIAATDALSQWILSEYEVGNFPWNELQNIHNNEDFKSFVELEIVSNKMKNDDTSMLYLII